MSRSHSGERSEDKPFQDKRIEFAKTLSIKGTKDGGQPGWRR